MKLFTLNRNILFYENYKAACQTACIYPSLGVVLKFFRAIINKYIPRLGPAFYTREFRRCGKHEDCIIIFDSSLTVAAANYIKKKYPSLRVIYWFWNHIYDSSIFEKLDSSIEKWTYDSVDSAKFGLKWNTQFYFPELVDETNGAYVESYDCVFAGAVKGRQREIEDCRKMVNAAELSNYFFIATGFKHGHYKKWLPYHELIKYVRNSKCVIDLLPATQNGMSLRPLEALFFEKKLITNYTRIKESRFYNPSNIFIIGEDAPDTLHEFVNTPVEPVNLADKEYYTFQSWLKRF